MTILSQSIERPSGEHHRDRLPTGTRILTAGGNAARVWDATTGGPCCFSITALPDGNYAVLTADSTAVIGATEDAWRWLGRMAMIDGKLTRIPVEVDAPLPPLDGAKTKVH